MFSFIKSSNGPADETSVRDFELKRGVELPASYRAFLLEHDGCELVDNTIQNEYVGEDHCEIRSLHGLRAKDDVLFSDLDSMQSCYENDISADYLFIAEDWGGNQFLISIKPPHSISWWDYGTCETIVVADDFSDLLASIVPTPPDPETPVELLGRTAQTIEEVNRFLESHEAGPEICYEAVKHGNLKLLILAIEHNIPTGDVLRVAAVNGEMAAVDLLLESGILINAPMADGRTALDWTEWREEYAAQLRQRGAKLSSELR